MFMRSDFIVNSYSFVYLYTICKEALSQPILGYSRLTRVIKNHSNGCVLETQKEKDITEDNTTIKAVLGGDTDLFSKLINKYSKVVEKIVMYHIGAEHLNEVANDIFFKAYKSLHRYRHDAPFSHWLSVIGVRTCKDFWRSKYSSKECSFSDLEKESSDNIADQFASLNSPEETILSNESVELVRKAMKILKPDERNIINLIYTEGLSIQETAVQLNLSESNVKVISFRARKKLKSELEKFFEV